MTQYCLSSCNDRSYCRWPSLNSILKTFRVLPTKIDRPNDLISKTSGRPNVWEMTGVTKHQSISKQGIRGTGGEWFKKRSLCVCVWHEYYLWGELKWAEQNLIIRNNSLLYFLRKVFTFPFWQFTTTLIGKDFIMKLTVEFSMVNIYSVSRLKVQTPELHRASLACLVFCFLFFVFLLKILSPRRLCLHDLLSPLHSFCIPCWELSVKYLGWSKSTDTNASIYQLFPSWNATTHVMSMFTSWLAIALGRKMLWVCSQYSHCLLLFSRCHVQLFATPWTAARQTPLSSTISQFARIRVHWIGDTH